ncbi:hypothetical protein [Kribbella sp. DT2]|uniref:hypothetical protein n=1 Tax=Kribbella sp. DT2 TaxID=3393427 RepID=UPI003CF079C3
MTEGRFLDRLLAAVPALRADWDRESAFQQEGGLPPTPGSFLIALGFSTVRRWAEGGTEATRDLQALLAFLEDEAADFETAELITKYVACLPDPGDRDDEVLDLLGPQLRELKNDQLRYDDKPASPAVVAFLHRLADEVPFLHRQVLEHFAQYQKPLGHLFLGGVVSDACTRYDEHGAAAVGPLLAFLEREFEQDPDVDNVIAVSFVELLPAPGQPGAGVETVLGPKLRAELDRQRAWRP